MYWRNSSWFIISCLVVALDQWSKLWIQQVLAPGESIAVMPFVNFTLAYNPGAAFSFLSQAGGWQRWLFTFIALGASLYFIYWFLSQKQLPKVLALGFSLILGGAVGNLWDRLSYGKVVDFIHVHYQQWSFPVFNVADSAITVGAVFVLFCLLPKSKTI